MNPPTPQYQATGVTNRKHAQKGQRNAEHVDPEIECQLVSFQPIGLGSLGEASERPA